jgi:hydrogenase 3 maturation protease
MAMKTVLGDILRGRVTIVGIGNVMRGDDGFGSILSNRIKGKVSAHVVNAGVTPENYLKAIRNSKPNTILLIDVADFDGGVGDIKLLKKEDIPLYGLSTHNASLALFFGFLEADTKAEVFMLAIQPGNSSINTSLSDIAEKRCQELESLLLELLPTRGHNLKW